VDGKHPCCKVDSLVGIPFSHQGAWCPHFFVSKEERSNTMSLQTMNSIGKKKEETKEVSFPALLMLPSVKKQIKDALPKHLNPDRMARIALTEYRRVPKLENCDPISILASVIQASQLGLEIGLGGEAYLVPFWNTKRQRNECQLIPGYRGLMKLGRQSGLVKDIYAHEVYLNDKFELKLGLERSLEHEPLKSQGGFPAPAEERGEIVGFYAVAILKDGTRTFIPMGVGDINKIRDDSEAYKYAVKKGYDTPWISNYVDMGLKTVIRALCSKRLPQSAELSLAIAMDDLNSRNQSQNLDLKSVIDGSYTVVETENEESPQTPAPSGQEAAPAPAPAAQTKPVAGGTQESGAANNSQNAGTVDNKDGKKLAGYLKKLESKKTVTDMDEVIILAEADLSDDDYAHVYAEYQRRKAEIEKASLFD
jgi:recombination protein RecT